MLANDPLFLVDSVSANLPHPRRRVPDGIQVCCPMCISMGHSRPDTKYRMGFRPFISGGFNINCFNCGYKIIWRPGSLLSHKIKKLLGVLGLSDQEISKLNFEAWRMRNNMGPEVANNEVPDFIPRFDECKLPPSTLSIDEWMDAGLEDENFIAVLQYAASRGADVLRDAKLCWTPDTSNNMHRRIIVPFYWNGVIVGYSGRSIDSDTRPKYYTSTPEHFIINNQALQKDRKFVMLVEGTFDAFAIDGVSTQGAKVSKEQAQWINSSGKEVIVVPDHDAASQPLVDAALTYGWKVSIPTWGSDIKDANDAVNAYGRLFTVQHIIKNASDNKMKINLLRKRLK